VDLGPSADDRWSLRSLASRLGVTLTRGNLRHAAACLLLDGREDGTRWRPIWPERDGVYRIWLGGLLWAMPALRGGVTLADTFNVGNNTVLAGDLPWTEVVGADWTTTSSLAQILGNNANAIAVCDTPLATNDMFAQFTIVTFTFGGGATHQLGPLVRKGLNATLTYYMYEARRTTTPANDHRLIKSVAGTGSVLGTDDPADVSNGEILKTEANGTSITGYLNGGVSVGPVTDSAIDGTTVGGKHVGMRSFANGTNNVTVDNFAAEDLVVGGETGISYHAHYAGRGR
jgi:hypothetical protein